MMLVTLAQAKEHVEIIGTSQDGKLNGYIRAASRAVMRYIGNDQDWIDSYGEPAVDSAGDAVDVPDDVQLATLLLVGIFFKDRDGTDSEKWQHGFLPTPVLSLLYPLRTPTLA